MMKYVLLAYRDERRWESMSQDERAAFARACQANKQELSHSLHLLDTHDLQDNTALTLRIVDGRVTISEGPLLTSQARLIQILFIQARDLNAALQITAKLPQAQTGHIEVRPIREAPSDRL